MRTIVYNSPHGYDTKGKQAVMPNGEIFEEWEFVRIMKLRIFSKLHRAGIPFVDLCPHAHDVSLRDRILRERVLSKKYGKTFLFEGHADAWSDEKANGITVFSSKAQNNSDVYSDILVDCYKHLGLLNRYDIDEKGLKGRDVDYYMIRNSRSPSCLVEWGFMTNPSDVMKLYDSSFQEKIADCSLDFFIKIQKM